MSLFRSVCAALPAVCALMAAVPAQAQAEAGDASACTPADFPLHTEFHLATVRASAAKLYFHDGGNGCPDRGASCQGKAYVVSGDTLLAGRRRGAWTCAFYVGKKRDTGGWVRSADLTLQTPPAPQSWGGVWSAHGISSYVGLLPKEDGWYVTGGATWGDGPTAQHSSLDGPVTIDGAHAHLGGTPGPNAHGCIADLTHIDRFLIVSDNGQCGSVKARFNGVYTGQE